MLFGMIECFFQCVPFSSSLVLLVNLKLEIFEIFNKKKKIMDKNSNKEKSTSGKKKKNHSNTKKKKR